MWLSMFGCQCSLPWRPPPHLILTSLKFCGDSHRRPLQPGHGSESSNLCLHLPPFRIQLRRRKNRETDQRDWGVTEDERSVCFYFCTDVAWDVFSVWSSISNHEEGQRSISWKRSDMVRDRTSIVPPARLFDVRIGQDEDWPTQQEGPTKQQSRASTLIGWKLWQVLRPCLMPFMQGVDSSQKMSEEAWQELSGRQDQETAAAAADRKD